VVEQQEEGRIVSQLIEYLKTLPPDAEVMVSAPLCCSQGPSYNPYGTLDLPVRGVRTGSFVYGERDGKPWVQVVGTDAWGLDQGLVP